MPVPHGRAVARIRVLTAALVVAVATTPLAACAPSTPGTPPVATAPTPAATEDAAAGVARGTGLKPVVNTWAERRIVDDAAAGSLVVAPPHRNGALAVFVHGSGEGRRTIVDDRRQSGVVHDLVEHGYVVLAADAGGRAWGDAASVADYRTLIARTERAYGLHDVFLMAESMGGLATMRLARTVPGVRAVTAWYPVYDLRTMATKHRFAGWIRRDWAGADRSVVSPVAVPRVPMMIWASAHDTVVSAALNARRLAAAERAAGGSVVYTPTIGNHGDASNFHPAAVVRFFDAHRLQTVLRSASATGTRKA
ncbi:hypothetical protein QDR37_01935 [Amnibacterium sp. CER49]|uniref:alpha/beta hydrolase family protein n=1 Tax=Amnibacterium sp. CER49 TaxID=3039161 RepID=UPI00244AF746|nr:hypothetical protein [Amnibacterium sp. CER49]MDH2442696.1 hypothetical protein [Amnibacterium sp. CER49]